MPNAPLSPFEAFRAGRRRDASGQDVAISRDDLVACAAAYDPARAPAPLVIGHPRIEDPAYGWVERLEVQGDVLRAVPERVEASFAQIVEDGRYRNVSASFYRPTARSNPVPGTWYLKHVGFLGAHPPAVQGLEPARFSAEDGEDETVTFALHEPTIARAFRRLREWIIGRHGVEEADQVLPAWEVDMLQEDAARPAEPGAAPITAPFAAPADPTPTTPTTRDETMTDPAAQAAERARLEAELARRDEQIAAFAAQAQQRRQADDAAFVDRMVAEARVPAGRRDEVAAFLACLDDVETVAFAAGEGAAPETPRVFFQRFLAGLRPAVAFGEEASGGRREAPRPDDLVARARRFQADRAALGETVSWAAAVDHVCEEASHA